MKKTWLGLWVMIGSLLPTLAWATEIHASGFIGPFLIILVICLLAGLALWAIRTWTPEMAKIWAVLPKLLTFIVVVFAVIWIIVLLARLMGINIT